MRHLALAFALLGPLGCGLGMVPAAGDEDTGLATEITEDDYPWANNGGGGGPGTDSGVADGGGEDGGQGGDGGGGTGGAGAPTLSNLSVSEGPSRIEVAFQVSDSDGDIEGGALWIEADGSSATYEIPGDISDWRPSGTSTQYLDVDDCSRGSRQTFQVQVFDAAGNASAVKSDDLTLSGSAEDVAEVGDAIDDIDNVGEIARDSWLCGDIYRTGNDGYSSYTGDVDIIKFRPASGGLWSFALTWDAGGADYDIHLYDGSWNLLMASAEFGTTQPERFSTSLSSGASYHLVVAGWSGGTGGYKVSAQ